MVMCKLFTKLHQSQYQSIGFHDDLWFIKSLHDNLKMLLCQFPLPFELCIFLSPWHGRHVPWFMFSF